jgi:hypothetical protein
MAELYSFSLAFVIICMSRKKICSELGHCFAELSHASDLQDMSLFLLLVLSFFKALFPGTFFCFLQAEIPQEFHDILH